MSVMAAPVTLPVKPINRENLGTSRASRYDVISKAPRTNRAGRDIPPRPPASVERLKHREREGKTELLAACKQLLFVGGSILTHGLPVAFMYLHIKPVKSHNLFKRYVMMIMR